MKSSRSNFLFPFAVLLGSSLLVLGAGIYSYAQASRALATPESAAYLVPVAEAYVLVILLGVIMLAVGAWQWFLQRTGIIRSRGLAPTSPGWIIPYALSLSKYKGYFVASTILYGVFYAFLTSMVVYQPGVDFVKAYGASVPSLTIVPVQAGPLFSPVVTVYITDHLGLLLIPLTILLTLAISVMVGVNVALAAFALGSRARGGRGWIAGVGAVVGLFTGCPTCAGLFFANVLGGSGAVSFAVLLGYYQPAFILLSLPVLLAAPYLMSHSLSKVYAEGCVVIR